MLAFAAALIEPMLGDSSLGVLKELGMIKIKMPLAIRLQAAWSFIESTVGN